MVHRCPRRQAHHPEFRATHAGAGHASTTRKPTRRRGSTRRSPGIRRSATTTISGWASYPVTTTCARPTSARRSSTWATSSPTRTASDSRDFYMGVLDGATPYGDIIGAGPVSELRRAPEGLPPTRTAGPLDEQEWMSEFFKTSSQPGGHGFTQANVDNGFRLLQFRAEVEYADQGHRARRHPDETTSRRRSTATGTARSTRSATTGSSANSTRPGRRQLMIIAAHVPIGVEHGAARRSAGAPSPT